MSHPAPAAAAQDSPTPHQPVLVELFTSEGCSDCPPADALLAQLDATQPVPGAQVIVLSEHVTYWNHLGWRDPFSLDAIDFRQQAYARGLGLSDVYTPQMVIDGAAQLVGNDTSALTRELTRAAKSAKTEITIENAAWKSDQVQFNVRSPQAQHQSLTAALAEDATHSEVAKGENAGRTLHHVAVVRVIQEMNSHATDGRLLTLKLPTQIGAANQTRTIRLVVFLSDSRTGHVTAVAQRTLTE